MAAPSSYDEDSLFQRVVDEGSAVVLGRNSGLLDGLGAVVCPFICGSSIVVGSVGKAHLKSLRRPALADIVERVSFTVFRGRK